MQAPTSIRSPVCSFGCDLAPGVQMAAPSTMWSLLLYVALLLQEIIASWTWTQVSFSPAL